MADKIKDSKAKDKPDYNGRIKRRGGKWVVFANDRKTVLGSHPTYAKAVGQIRAVIIQRLKAGGKFGK